MGDTVHCTCLAVIRSDWPATTNLQAVSLRAAPSCILLGHLHVGLTQTCLQGWNCAAHGTRATAWSQCVPESRGRPCATGSGKLHASVKCAVPKSGPRNGPISGPPGGSTNSWWNRMGVQILGSIGGPFFLSLKARDSSSRVVVHAQQPWDCDEIPWRDKIPGCCCVEMASVGLHQFAEKAIEPSKRCSW